MKNYLAIGILVVIVLAFIVYSVFWLNKKITYEVLYENQVQQTVKDMVKPEYLNEQYKK